MELFFNCRQIHQKPFMLLQRSGRFCRLLLSAVPVIIPWSGHFQQHPSAALPSDRRGITEIIPYNQDSFPRGTLGKKAPSTVCSFLAASCLSSLSVFPAIRAGRRAPLLSPSDWTQLNSFLSLMFFVLFFFLMCSRHLSLLFSKPFQIQKLKNSSFVFHAVE